MSRSEPANPSSFPHWVALASLGLVLWLFFGNTVPALHEREQLISLQTELEDLHRRYDGAIRQTMIATGANKDIDFQGLLVAIDQRGLTPAELHAAYPELPTAGHSGQPPESPKQRTKP